MCVISKVEHLIKYPIEETSFYFVFILLVIFVKI